VLGKTVMIVGRAQALIAQPPPDDGPSHGVDDVAPILRVIMIGLSR
jgi:hypothetical protein